MGFDTFLGNRQLKANLAESLRKGQTSHFYMLSGPAGSGKRTLARLLAAALLCQGPEKPCLRCNACRKVMEGIHPDVIQVVDPDHKAVSVKIIRDIREDLFIRPNEGQKKIYIFPQALNSEGMNALLKVLEEPPDYGVFLLLAENPSAVLPTVRSRCTELRLQALEPEILRDALKQRFPTANPESVEAAIIRSGGFLGQGEELLREEAQTDPLVEKFVQTYARRDAVALLEVLAPMEKWKRDPLIAMLEQFLAQVESGLVCRGGLPAPSPMGAALAAGRSTRELMDGAACLKKMLEYARGNVSPGAICGYLAWALR